MGYRCCIPSCKFAKNHCRNGTAENNNTKVNYFNVPSDPMKFKAWRQAIPFKNIAITPSSRVCELHFEKSELIKYFEVVMIHGVETVEEQSALLNPNSVPSIFPKCPVINKFSNKSKRSICSNNKEETNTTTNNNYFNELAHNIKDIPLPSSMWSSTVFKEAVIFICWNDSYTLQKKIVIDYKLNVKVFVGNIQVTSLFNKTPCKHQDIVNMIRVVQNIHYCDNVYTMGNKKCYQEQNKRRQGIKKNKE